MTGCWNNSRSLAAQCFVYGQLQSTGCCIARSVVKLCIPTLSTRTFGSSTQNRKHQLRRQQRVKSTMPPCSYQEPEKYSYSWKMCLCNIGELHDKTWLESHRQVWLPFSFDSRLAFSQPVLPRSVRQPRKPTQKNRQLFSPLYVPLLPHSCRRIKDACIPCWVPGLFYSLWRTKGSARLLQMLSGRVWAMSPPGCCCPWSPRLLGTGTLSVVLRHLRVASVVRPTITYKLCGEF